MYVFFNRCLVYFFDALVALVSFRILAGLLILELESRKDLYGDVGSTFLGAVFAGLVLQAANWSDAFGYLLLLLLC